MWLESSGVEQISTQVHTLRLEASSDVLTKCAQLDIFQSVVFAFDPEKNNVLRKKRSVTFPMVIEAIAEKGILAHFDHPNKEKYPGQRVLVVELEGNAYCVPYVVDGNVWFLKTIYPSRQFKHLVEGNPDGEI